MKVLLRENRTTCHFRITVNLTFYEDIQYMAVFACINFVGINFENKKLNVFSNDVEK